MKSTVRIARCDSPEISFDKGGCLGTPEFRAFYEEIETGFSAGLKRIAVIISQDGLADELDLAATTAIRMVILREFHPRSYFTNPPNVTSYRLDTLPASARPEA